MIRTVLLAGAALAAFSVARAEGLPPNSPSLPSPFATAPTLRTGIEPQANPAVPPTAPGADLAFGAFQRGYFATAMAEAMKRVNANPKDGAAMALVGEIYAQGLAVRRDPAEAARWDKLGTDQGNREAIFGYAMALLKGEGVPKDKDKAKALFEKAAAMGHAGAMYNLGVLAINADGKEHNFGVAAAHFRHAMEHGDLDATAALAALYKGGMGVALNEATAAQLYKQAADQGHAGAQVEYGIILFNGEGVPADEAAAARYFIKAAYLGNPIAEDRLARLYQAGRGVPRDPVEAARWHILAHAAGIKDPWLDDQLASLTAGDRSKVEDILRKQLGQ